MSAPVPADPIAIAAYHAISREMLSAYPAEYNIFGALFNVIKGIGSAVLPSILPTIGNLFGGKSEPPPVTPSYAANSMDSDRRYNDRFRDDERYRQRPVETIRYVDRPAQEKIVYVDRPVKTVAKPVRARKARRRIRVRRN